MILTNHSAVSRWIWTNESAEQRAAYPTSRLMMVVWPNSLLFPKFSPWKLIGKMTEMETRVSRARKAMR